MEIHIYFPEKNLQRFDNLLIVDVSEVHKMKGTHKDVLVMIIIIQFGIIWKSLNLPNRGLIQEHDFREELDSRWFPLQVAQ